MCLGGACRAGWSVQGARRAQQLCTCMVCLVLTAQLLQCLGLVSWHTCNKGSIFGMIALLAGTSSSLPACDVQHCMCASQHSIHFAAIHIRSIPINSAALLCVPSKGKTAAARQHSTDSTSNLLSQQGRAVRK